MLELAEINNIVKKLQTINTEEELWSFFRDLKPSVFSDMYTQGIGRNAFQWQRVVVGWEALEEAAGAGALAAIRLQLIAWKHLSENVKKSLQEKSDLLDAYTEDYFMRRLQWQTTLPDAAIIATQENKASNPGYYYHRVMQRLELIFMHNYKDLPDEENSLASLSAFFCFIKDEEKIHSDIKLFRNYLCREYVELCQKYFAMTPLPVLNLEGEMVPVNLDWNKVNISKEDRIRLEIIANLSELLPRYKTKVIEVSVTSKYYDKRVVATTGSTHRRVPDDHVKYPRVKDTEFLLEFFRMIAHEIRLQRRVADQKERDESDVTMKKLVTELEERLRQLHTGKSSYVHALLCYINLYLGDDFTFQFNFSEMWEKVLKIECNEWQDSTAERKLALMSINKVLENDAFYKRSKVTESDRLYYQRQLYLLLGNVKNASPTCLLADGEMSTEMVFQIALHDYEKLCLSMPNTIIALDLRFTDMAKQNPEIFFGCVLLELQKLMARNGETVIARVPIAKFDDLLMKNVRRACNNKITFRDNGLQTFRVLRMVLQGIYGEENYRELVRLRSETAYQKLNRLLRIFTPGARELLKAEAESRSQAGSVHSGSYNRDHNNNSNSVNNSSAVVGGSNWGDWAKQKISGFWSSSTEKTPVAASQTPGERTPLKQLGNNSGYSGNN